VFILIMGQPAHMEGSRDQRALPTRSPAAGGGEHARAESTWTSHFPNDIVVGRRQSNYKLLRGPKAEPCLAAVIRRRQATRR